MAKVSVRRDEEIYQILFTQEGRPGISINEADLYHVLKAIEDPEHENIYLGSRIGVSKSAKSVILYDLVQGKKRTCISLTKMQAGKLAKALQTSYEDVINSYRYHISF